MNLRVPWFLSDCQLLKEDSAPHMVKRYRTERVHLLTCQNQFLFSLRCHWDKRSLGCAAASEGTWLPTFRGDVVVCSTRVAVSLGNGTPTLPRNVGNELSSNTASYPRRLYLETACSSVRVLEGPSGDLGSKESKLYLYTVCVCCPTVWLPEMTVVLVGCEKWGIGCSSQHLIFNYIQQTTSHVCCASHLIASRFWSINLSSGRQ